MAKVKKCSAIKATNILSMIDDFRTTAKGDNDRAHFGPIVAEAIRSKLMERDETTSFGLSAYKASKALQGMPTGADKGARATIVAEIERRAILRGGTRQPARA